MNTTVEDIQKYIKDNYNLDFKLEYLGTQREIQKQKKQIREGWFPCKRNNYCCLKSDEKQYLFKSYASVAMFLDIKAPAITYRMNKKNGYINDIWHLEKITKEDFDFLSNKLEVIV